MSLEGNERGWERMGGVWGGSWRCVGREWEKKKQEKVGNYLHMLIFLCIFAAELSLATLCLPPQAPTTIPP